MTCPLKETEIKDRFTEHKLRAKVASDAERLERAKQLMTHSDTKITERGYRREPERVRWPTPLALLFGDGETLLDL